jgi:hypothetical protein
LTPLAGDLHVEAHVLLAHVYMPAGSSSLLQASSLYVHARESMYINSPDYLATCKKVEKFIQVMQKPMMESIRLKVRISHRSALSIW